MDISALQVFLAVAEAGSFTRAAERIYLTQPAISKRIAALESEIGTRLFDRIGRGIHLTPAGEALLSRARTVLQELEDVKRGITNLSGTITGELHVATSHHIGLHRLPGPLKRFHDTYPQVRLNLQFMDSEKACQAIAKGDIELAVVTLPTITSAPLKTETIWDDPLDIVVSPGHPLAQERRVKLEILLDYPAILPGPGTYTREIILNAFGSLRDRIQIGMATNYLEVLKMLAAIGLGWSALPRTMIDEGLKVVQIEKGVIRRELGIVTHEKRTLSNAGAALIRIIRDTRK
ncbi:MAG: LysR family transcriptional regulator [Gammaproteobacteria bacterium]|nr:LysR family transcriptional regulator [Gammaproteobacteria bacterium]MDH3370091.1 LysR family transcriptional regulator [Gammaproteobacteria bacterium]MDH3406979.1 LysR family transcriptional regulator [Gammaproteobacteria bacterium]MDH5486024.1 LysR family transcriptional regulator [Gammaproteobacteria bacterium]